GQECRTHGCIEDLPVQWRLVTVLGDENGRLRSPKVLIAPAWFFAGMIATCAGSSVYHLSPEGQPGLALDRAGMAVAFAGFLGMAASTRISPRAGRSLTLAMAPAALLAAVIATSNLTPWTMVQFGGILLAAALALTPPLPGARIPLAAVLAFYLLAKLFELSDAQIFAATGHIVSGHTIKHLAAAAAAWPVIRAMTPAKAF
ncbi:MAG: hypothetical protein FWD68_05980, partial [Alphaproteobacteria bacterium]|nr:hypothetical protein [Alphaproteobacteria bacterium]